MSLHVATNVQSMNAYRHQAQHNQTLAETYQRLSSGKRINTAADDAAGLQITSRLTAQINGTVQGARNANDGISVAQTAESAMGSAIDVMQRMRTLALQSANGSNTSRDRTALHTEFFELKQHIDRLGNDTLFAGQPLLNSTYSEDFQVGADANQVVNVQVPTPVTLAGLGLTLASISTVGGSQSSITALDSAIERVGEMRSELGAKINRFSSSIRNLHNVSNNVSAARSRINDTDFAVTSAKLARTQVLQQGSTSMLSQANQMSELALSLIAA